MGSALAHDEPAAAPREEPWHVDGVASTGALVVELSQLEYAVRATETQNGWLSKASGEDASQSLLLRRNAVLVALRHRGVDFADHRAEPAPPRHDIQASWESRSPQPESTHTRELAAQVEHLQRALATRTVIGQAAGILIERHKVTADDAFRMLVTASSLTNRKLRDIARGLVRTGEMPGRPLE